MRICFVAITAYPLIKPDSDIRRVGGAELQQAMIARALAERGHDVSMVCMDHGQEDGVVIDGVTVYKCFKPDEGIRVLRFVHPRFTGIWRAMQRANADIYYQRAAAAITGFVAAYCRRRHKISVFCGAGNPDFEKNSSRMESKYEKVFYEYGLRNVNQILVQNDDQASLCRQNFARESIIVPNGYQLPAAATADPNGYVLWVSTIRALKNPGAFLALARELPQFQFRMIGGPGADEEDLYQQVAAEAASITNLEFLGFVPFSDIEPHFNGARLLVNTSDSEGFPNTFLQSWSRGIPTISFIDCGARRDGHAIGWIAASQKQMADFIEELMASDERWQESGSSVLAYFEENNTMEKAVLSYERIFGSLLES